MLCEFFRAHACRGRDFNAFTSSTKFFVYFHNRLVPIVVVIGLTVPKPGHSVTLHTVGLITIKESLSLGD